MCSALSPQANITTEGHITCRANISFRDSGTHRSHQKKHLLSQVLFLVRRKGLEPPAYWFVASHSIQLSYRRKLKRAYVI